MVLRKKTNFVYISERISKVIAFSLVLFVLLNYFHSIYCLQIHVHLKHTSLNYYW